MRSITMALRRPLVNSSLTWQTQAAPSLRNLGPRIRQFHPSPFPRRAPVPNPPPRPTTSTLGTTNGVSGSSTLGSGAGNGGRPNGSGSGGKRPSPHAMWYREIVPAMIPPLLLSLTIFLSLSLLRLHLSHQLSLSEQQTQIAHLERELERLRREAIRRAEREKRERERMLPVVVGKVLQRVGVMRDSIEEVEEEEEGMRLLV